MSVSSIALSLPLILAGQSSGPLTDEAKDILQNKLKLEGEVQLGAEGFVGKDQLDAPVENRAGFENVPNLRLYLKIEPTLHEDLGNNKAIELKFTEYFEYKQYLHLTGSDDTKMGKAGSGLSALFKLWPFFSPQADFKYDIENNDRAFPNEWLPSGKSQKFSTSLAANSDFHAWGVPVRLSAVLGKFVYDQFSWYKETIGSGFEGRDIWFETGLEASAWLSRIGVGFPDTKVSFSIIPAGKHETPASEENMFGFRIKTEFTLPNPTPYLPFLDFEISKTDLDNNSIFKWKVVTGSTTPVGKFSIFFGKEDLTPYYGDNKFSVGTCYTPSEKWFDGAFSSLTPFVEYSRYLVDGFDDPWHSISGGLLFAPLVALGIVKEQPKPPAPAPETEEEPEWEPVFKSSTKEKRCIEENYMKLPAKKNPECKEKALKICNSLAKPNDSVCRKQVARENKTLEYIVNEWGKYLE
jgi:hypothetical protein